MSVPVTIEVLSPPTTNTTEILPIPIPPILPPPTTNTTPIPPTQISPSILPIPATPIPIPTTQIDISPTNTRQPVRETGMGIENKNSKNILETKSIIGISLGIGCFLILIGATYVYMISKRKKKESFRKQQMELDDILSKKDHFLATPINSQHSFNTIGNTIGESEERVKECELEMQTNSAYTLQYPIIQEYIVPNQNGPGYAIEYYDQYGQRYN